MAKDLKKPSLNTLMIKTDVYEHFQNLVGIWKCVNNILSQLYLCKYFSFFRSR